MIKNYFKTAWRNLCRNKVYSAITISGLSLAMAGAILLLLWIQHTLSIDQFHAKSSVLYKVYKKTILDGSIETSASVPAALAPGLLKDQPEVKASARVIGADKIISTTTIKLAAAGNIVDPSFLTMFSFPLETGNAANALNDEHAVLLTTTLAKKLFNGGDPMYQTVQLDGDNFTVTGILRDLPSNTQFHFEFLLPWRKAAVANTPSWTTGETVAYVELDARADVDAVNKKVSDVISRHAENNLHTQVFLYPFSKTFLYGDFNNGIPAGGGITVVRLLFLVVLMLLLIGSINFMNLSTARGEQRAKEVGVRKIAGAGKLQLMIQFIAESILLSLIAGAIAVLIAELLLPFFNSLTEKQLTINYRSLLFWISALGFVSFTGLLAGSYPAFYLSSFKAIKGLKKTMNSRYAMLTPRKVLVVLQFVVSIVMINYSYVIIKQTNFVTNRETGFVKDELLFHPLTAELQKNFVALQQDLMNSGKIVSMNKTNGLITSSISITNGLGWNGTASADQFQLITSNASMVKTGGLTLLAGRDVDTDHFAGDTASCVINETAVKLLGNHDVLGKQLRESGTTCTIVGVVKDFVNDYPGHAINPLMIRGSNSGSFINMRLHPGSSNADISAVNEILRKYNRGYITELQFGKEDYAKKFKGATVSIMLATVFSLVTMFIACLGLLGLGIFMVTTRRKEISIRKVLGAGAATLTWLLTRDFIKLVLIAVLIASPLAWLLMNAAVQNFAYRINVHWWMLLATGIISVLIAAATVGFQSAWAARATPSKNLRTE